MTFHVNHLLGICQADDSHEMSCLNNKIIKIFSLKNNKNQLTFKTPRKPASENVVCLCRLLNILANFSNLFLHTGK